MTKWRGDNDHNRAAAVQISPVLDSREGTVARVPAVSTGGARGVDRLDIDLKAGQRKTGKSRRVIRHYRKLDVAEGGETWRLTHPCSSAWSDWAGWGQTWFGGSCATGIAASSTT